MSLSKDAMRIVEGNLSVAPGARFAIVASRFNHFIVDRLVDGALDALVRHGATPNEVTVIRVPGAWEIPLVVDRVAASKKIDAVISSLRLRRGRGHEGYCLRVAQDPSARGDGNLDDRQHRASHRAGRYEGGQQGLGCCGERHRDVIARPRARQRGALGRMMCVLRRSFPKVG
jgi:hypothetical protein